MPRVRQTPRKAAQIERPSRLKLLLRRQRRLLWLGLRGAVLLGVAGAAVVILRSVDPGGSITSVRERFGKAVGLRVTDITVDGRRNTPQKLLDEAIGVAAGDPILGYSVADARLRIESLSWVAHASVERRMPGSIHVSLVERAPFAIWQNQGRFLLIGRDGQVVTGENVANFADLPLLVGAGAPVEAAALVDALSAQPVIRPRVAASIRVGERRWNLQLHSGTVVMLPESHAPEALARLAQYQASHDLLDRPLRVIDMRLPDRLVLRPVAPPPVADTPPARRAT